MTGIPEGWTLLPVHPYGAMVGPFYQSAPRGLEFGFRADERHANRRGVCHGGMLATAFDITMGNACWDAANDQPSATVQLNVTYVGALALGEFARIRVEIVRTTRSLVFARGVMTADERVVATADGVWKILKWRGEPWKAPG